MARAAKPPGISERRFQALVVTASTLLGYRVYHTHDSRRSDKGWPDLVLCRPPRLIFAELKSATGKVKKEQREWLDLLGACPGVEQYLWRPADWPLIEETLR